MARRKVSKEQAVEHERRAWEMCLEGKTHRQIALVMDLHPSAIGPILDRAAARVKAETSQDVTRYILTQNAIYQHLISENLEAWEKSKKEAKSLSKSTTRHTSGDGGEGGGVTEKEQAEVQFREGDPVWQEQLRAALKGQADLLGLEAAKKVEHKTEHSGGLEITMMRFHPPAPTTEDTDEREANGPDAGDADGAG